MHGELFFGVNNIHLGDLSKLFIISIESLILKRSQVPMLWNTVYGVHNPGLALDFHRWHSDTTIEFLKFQRDLVRQYSPNKVITSNGMGLFSDVDYFRFYKELDFLAWDNCKLQKKNQKFFKFFFFLDPMGGNSDYSSSYSWAGLGHDVMRGANDQQNFMIMEQQGGMTGWTTYGSHQVPGALYRCYAYQSVTLLFKDITVNCSFFRLLMEQMELVFFVGEQVDMALNNIGKEF